MDKGKEGIMPIHIDRFFDEAKQVDEKPWTVTHINVPYFPRISFVRVSLQALDSSPTSWQEKLYYMFINWKWKIKHWLTMFAPPKS